MRQLHLLRRPGDALARDVVRHQLAGGDEVRVVLMLDAAVEGTGSLPDGAEGLLMPPLQYDQLVEHLAWCDRVVSW
ncbi:MAG: hypothetical protein ACR2MY_11685 [Candidatus Dormibacteria bacterium]